MGNHTAGRAMGLAAQESLWSRQNPPFQANQVNKFPKFPHGAGSREAALAILDRICEPYRGCDAEFEASDPNAPNTQHPDFIFYTDPHPGAALGMLMLEAFAPNGLADLPRYAAMVEGNDDDEEICMLWWDEVKAPVRKRYDLC